MKDDTICTKGQDKLCRAVYVVAALALIAVLLSGCDRGPTEEDMAGCAVRARGPTITAREVADCAVDRAAREQKP